MHSAVTTPYAGASRSHTPHTPHTPMHRLDAAINSIQPKCFWGLSILPDAASINSVLLRSDNEYVMAVGSNLCMYSSSAENKPGKLILPQVAESWQVTYMSLSNDCNYLAVCFKVRNESQPLRATLYVYDLSSLGSGSGKESIPGAHIRKQPTTPGLPQKPRLFTYVYTPPSQAAANYETIAAELDSIEQHRFTAVSFSQDNFMLACATNISMVGCLVFDAMKGEVLLEILPPEKVSQIAFNPRDSQKLCTIGEKSLFQLWRFAGGKNIHPAPIHGLAHSEKYTSMVWLEGEETRIVAGSREGFLIIVQGTEQLQQPCYAFGAPGQQGSMPSSIVNLLTRGDFIVAVSESNYFSLVEVKRFSGSGAQAATATLIPLAIFQLADVDVICGFQWSRRKSSGSSLQHSFVVTIASSSAITEFDIKADTMGSKANLEAGITTGPAMLQAGNRPRLGADALCTPAILKIVESDKTLTNFHRGVVSSISVAARNATFVSASNVDESLRVRNFSSFNSPSQVVASFSEFKNQIPNFVDIHPSGLFVASACEDEAVEFMISDTSVGAVKRIPVKIPLTLPNGTPFVNTQHVSVVRYSNSGHYLAVVTGRYARLFNMLDLEISSTDSSGSPRLSMFMMDNTGNITDLAFSKDDTRIFTTASDGFVYSWVVGDTVRSGEFNHKGVSATKIATNGEGTIVAVFDSDIGIPAATSRKTIRVGFGTGSGKRGLVNNRRGPGGAGLTRSNSVVSVGGGEGKVVADNTGTLGDLSNTIETDAAAAAAAGPKRFLVSWTGNVSMEKGSFIYLETPAISVALGTIDAPTKKSICVLGLADGRVLISLLPFPLRTVNLFQGLTALSVDFATTTTTTTTTTAAATNTMAATAATTAATTTSYLEDSKCKILQLHKDPVSCVSITASGLWIFTAGHDGSIYMLSTSLRARDMLEVPEASTARENDYVLTEKEQLSSLRARIADVETVIAETKRDSERVINKLTESSAEVKAELEKRMRNDIKKRDEIILRSREEFLKSTKDLNAQISKIIADNAKEVSELEAFYERKLSKEGLYLEKMRQAYDEFVLHARMDMNDLREEVEKEKKSLESKHNSSQKDAEKQKSALLLYVDFVNARNKEVLSALEDHQDNEKHKLKDKISEAARAVERSQQEGRAELATLTIQNGKLKHVISAKDEDIMRLQSDLGWANERIQKLEMALQEAANEVRKKFEMAERWEFKAGESQQQLSELERVRKVLTSQLHGLRQELGPKEEKLSKVTERLQEVDREYELTLHAISEKEKLLNQKNQNSALLKKQVRDYRSLSARRDQSLRRAAKLLEEFKLSLEEAQFKAYKKTVGGGVGEGFLSGTGGEGDNKLLAAQSSLGQDDSGEQHVVASSAVRNKPGQVVEMMARTESMENSLRRLSDLLGPYLRMEAVSEDAKEDEILAAEERERQLKMLHKSIRGLQSNLENTSVLAQTKVGNHLVDNRILLEEINALRQQVRSVSMENQRLKAKIEFSDVLQSKGRAAGDSQLTEPHAQIDFASSRKAQDSLSEASLHKGGSITSLTKSKSTDSNIIHITGGGSKLDLQLSGSNSVDNFASSISLDAQRNAAELRDQILSKLNEARTAGGGESVERTGTGQRHSKSRDGPTLMSRSSAADKKIDALIKENEDAIREGAAAEILASYQKQIQENSKTLEAKAAAEARGDRGKKSLPPATAAIKKAVVPLSVERLNKNVMLPSL